MKKLLLLLFIFPFLAISQEQGIQFEHQTTWAKVKEKAKSENKHIFVDVFTTWCGPCKYMAANIFPQEKVGTFFNKNFVNLKIQMDETPADSEEIQSWRAEAKRFAKDYSIQAYPTFLIFNPNGELVHRIVGGGEADDFIAKATEGLSPETQYVTVKKKFEANPNDPLLAKKIISLAIKAYDQELASSAMEVFIKNTKKEDLFTKENLQLICHSVKSSKSSGFTFILENKDKIDQILEEKITNQLLSVTIINTEIWPLIQASNEDILNQTYANVSKKYPTLDINPYMAQIKTSYYLQKKNWVEFRNAVQEYINANPSRVHPSELNNFAWSIFENCDDPKCLESALAWSKKSIENNEDPMFLDTYANLLYKTGKVKEAITVQEKALSLVDNDSKVDYQKTLDKMKKGIPTWGQEQGE
ncbi:thioredoxin fold domain-containing protein [Sphingobacterium sp. HJSM2_6]|uniref:thioredoxin fold domain-containing protein n=1 Tax=Sphingobacterium sp. HJSM2_6 TaxID=3366264 RepID=UPI003BCC30E0